MAGDDALLFGLHMEEVAHPTGYVAVARAVEPIAAHAVFRVEFVGDGIHIGFLRHGLVERRVEHAHLRQSRHEFGYCLHTFQVGRIVERCQVDAFLEHAQHFVVDDHTLVELLSTVHHPVSHGIYLPEVFDGSDFRVGEQ